MEKFSRLLIGFGIAITLWVYLFESSGVYGWESLNDFLEDMIFLLMLAVPWILLLALHIRRINRVGVMLSAVAMVVFEVIAYYATFVNPQSSTAALAYAVKPFYQFIFMAVGLLTGWAVNHIKTRKNTKSTRPE